VGILHIFAADLEGQINSLGLRTVLVATLVLTVCIGIAFFTQNRIKWLKLPLFIVMAGTLVLSTLVLMGGTVYLNTKAESKGPVHWHSDIEFWACGSELNLRDPTGFLSNKVGTATYHEHNDKRIHLEGVVVRKSEDASLEKFMRVTGGFIHDNGIGIPLNENEAEWLATEGQRDGDDDLRSLDSLKDRIVQAKKGAVLELNNDQDCAGQNSELQVFVYSFDKASKTYSQHKVESPGHYVMRGEPVVPPGDCVIVEFDRPKLATDKLCRQYGVRDAERCTQFGVASFNPELCNIREATRSGGGE
jgi:hypothetical protein